MGRISSDQYRVIKTYVFARYSHWSVKDRKFRLSQVVRALKKNPEQIGRYVMEASEALARSGL